MKKTCIVFFILIIVFPGRLKAETVVAREVENFYYDNGRIEERPVHRENTYVVEDNKITRTQIRNLESQEAVPDDTVYEIQRQLVSDPTNELRAADDLHTVRAVGAPDPDSIEVLSIHGDDTLETFTFMAGHLEVSRFKRIQSEPKPLGSGPSQEPGAVPAVSQQN